MMLQSVVKFLLPQENLSLFLTSFSWLDQGHPDFSQDDLPLLKSPVIVDSNQIHKRPSQKHPAECLTIVGYSVATLTQTIDPHTHPSLSAVSPQHTTQERSRWDGLLRGLCNVGGPAFSLVSLLSTPTAPDCAGPLPALRPGLSCLCGQAQCTDPCLLFPGKRTRTIVIHVKKERKPHNRFERGKMQSTWKAHLKNEYEIKYGRFGPENKKKELWITTLPASLLYVRL